MAKSHYTTKPLSQLFTNPALRAAFKAAEDDGLSPSPVTADQPRRSTGGAAVRAELELA